MQLFESGSVTPLFEGLRFRVGETTAARKFPEKIVIQVGSATCGLAPGIMADER